MNIAQSKAKWWLMAVSITLGCVSAWAIDQHLNEKTEEIESRSRLDQLTLLVAARDLSRDMIMEDTDFVPELYPVKFAPDDALTLEQSENLIGKKLLADVRAGQPLLSIYLNDPETPSMSTRLDPSLKAISMTLDASSAASGLIRTGDRVDLFVSLDHQGKRVTVGLMHAVLVLGTGNLLSTTNREDSLGPNQSNITLAVSHRDAVKLVAAREAGTISAVLSAPIPNTEAVRVQGHAGDLAQLLGLPTEPIVQNIPILYGDRLSVANDEAALMDRSHESALTQRSVRVK
jgi:pilus assembly protein CpaB